MSSPSGEGERPPIRIGTKEREATYAALNAHLDAGRLDADEYGERYAQASVARTRPELEALFTDLPAPHPVFDEPAAHPSWATGQPRWTGNRRRSAYRFVPAAFMLLPVLAIVLAVSTGFWFLIFAIPFGASVVGRRFGHRAYGGHGRRRYGPGGYC